MSATFTAIMTEAKQAAAYKAGQLAFEQNMTMGNCPYSPKDNRYLDWLDGFLDARTRSRLGHIFEKWGMKYP